MADYVSALNGLQMDEALMDMAEHNSEAFAVGERNGVPVVEGDVTYHNNSQYWASFAADAAEGASVITDPNEDGNLVIDSPSGNESGWAVRYDAAQDLSDAQKMQARKNIAAGGTNENLLMNPWFRVNQRGQTSGTLLGDYVADRWRPSYGSGGVTWSRTDDVVTVCSTTGTSQGYLFQNLEPSLSAWLANRTVTLSIMRGDYTIMATSFVWPSSGTRSATIGDDADGNSIAFLANADTKRINVYKNYTALNVRAIKLELGSVSTLANDAPPDYGMELAKCKRYFRRIKSSISYTPVGYGFQTSSTRCHIKIAGEMREAPTPTFSGTLRLVGNASASIDVTSLNVGQTDAEGVTILANTAGSLTENHTYTLYLTNGSYIDLSADL